MDGDVAKIQCARCLYIGQEFNRATTRWDCPCGCSYCFRRCFSCLVVSLVTSLQRRGEPWHCTWCNAANQGFSRRNDPAAATIGDLAVDMASHGLEFKQRQPQDGVARDTMRRIPPVINGSVDLQSTVVFRRSLVRWWTVFGASVVPGFVFFSGVVADSTHGWEKIACGAAMLAFVILGIRIARLGIFAEPDQLAVRNWFRTYRIAWQDISAFEMPPLHGTLRKAGLRIHLLDHRVISATLYARGGFDSGRAARTVVEELEQLRHQRVPDAVTAKQQPGPSPEYDQRV
jgi:hypothetical protein